MPTVSLLHSNLDQCVAEQLCHDSAALFTALGLDVDDDVLRLEFEYRQYTDDYCSSPDTCRHMIPCPIAGDAVFDAHDLYERLQDARHELVAFTSRADTDEARAWCGLVDAVADYASNHWRELRPTEHYDQQQWSALRHAHRTLAGFHLHCCVVIEAINVPSKAAAPAPYLS